MDRRTVYLDLDHAALSPTHEGVEIATSDDVVVLSGTRGAFRALMRQIDAWDPSDVEPASTGATR